MHGSPQAHNNSLIWESGPSPYVTICPQNLPFWSCTTFIFSMLKLCTPPCDLNLFTTASYAHCFDVVSMFWRETLIQRCFWQRKSFVYKKWSLGYFFPSSHNFYKTTTSQWNSRSPIYSFLSSHFGLQDIFPAWLRKAHIVNERLARLCYIIVRFPSQLRLICEPVQRCFRHTPFVIDSLGLELLCSRSSSINTAAP